MNTENEHEVQVDYYNGVVDLSVIDHPDAKISLHLTSKEESYGALDFLVVNASQLFFQALDQIASKQEEVE